MDKLDSYLHNPCLPRLNLKAVLFDMDGVLYNSMPNHAEAWYKTCSSFGLHSVLEDFYAMEGATSSYTVNTLYCRQYGHEVSEEKVREVYDLKTRFFEQLPPPDMMQGAHELLKQVKADGLMPAIVTGSSQRVLLNRIAQAYPGIFDLEKVVTGDMVKRGKPDPEPYLRGLALCGCAPNEAIVVENAPLGVRSGKAAGMVVIAVNTGPLKNQLLLDAGADLLFGSMTELSERWTEVKALLQR